MSTKKSAAQAQLIKDHYYFTPVEDRPTKRTKADNIKLATKVMLLVAVSLFIVLPLAVCYYR